MTPEALAAFCAVFPDPMFIVSLEGRIEAANAAAHRLPGAGANLIGRRLSEFAGDPPQLARSFAIWGRSGTLTAGAFTWRGASGLTIDLRVDGARIQPHAPGTLPAILLWCRPKSDAEATSRFLRLNERIAALNREISERKRIETALREQREWFRVTLASIGDAVVTTDQEGRITFLNAAAQELTGWPEAEAIGKYVTDVLPLVNEETRAAAENPVTRVLREGRVVGLANHTVLIDRHGGAHHIADSAAPISEDGSPPVGVVLVFQDVTERQRLYREIARRAEELAQIDRRKDEFLAMLGHELRNPLAALANASAVRRIVPADDPAHRRAADVMDRQLHLIERLVDDLLDVARIRRGAIELRHKTFDLGLAVDRAVDGARPAFHAKGIDLIVRQAAEPLHIEADPVRIEQVVANLLSNAVKYTPPAGRVEIVISARDDDVVVTVRDTGIGIDPTLLPAIFELFVQGPRSLHRPEGGLGIGLTLVRTVVELHGGRVEAESQGPGFGSTFRVTLPRVRATTPTGSMPRADVAPRGVTVLVVDDHADSADMLSVLLAARGHQVEIASDGPAALLAAARLRPRVVLLDIGLPGMDGYAVASALRRMPELEGLVIVALTGYGQLQDRQRALEAGCDMHFVKPLAPEQLDTLLESID